MTAWRRPSGQVMRGDHPSGGQRPTPEGSLFAPCLQSRGAMRELPLLKMRQLILIFSKENQNVGILRGEQCLELVQQIFERLAGW